MASGLSPKPSKRQHVSKAIQRGYRIFKRAVWPSSQISTRPPESSGTVRALILINPAPTLSPEPTTANKLREAGGAAWSGLEAALRMLEKSADVFPTLKSVTDDFIACLDIVQAAAMNSEGYKELASELTTMTSMLSQYLGELSSDGPSSSAARLALSIEAELANISKQQGRIHGSRTVESTQEKEDVINCYRRIEGLFRQLQGDVGLRTLRNTNKQHMTALLRGMSPVDDARYNSTYSITIERRGCVAGTRQKLQAGIQDWVQDGNAAQVYWMNGMAGIGKTTVAYSLCEWLEANQRLGASFFCSRVSSSCRNVNRIVPTIAYQLARYSPTYLSALREVLTDDSDVSELNVVKQFEKLVREPMLASKDAMPEGVVVVIDALDECEDNYGAQLVLGMLLRLGANLPLKFFVSSRPEPAIQDSMLSLAGYSRAMLHLEEIEQSIVEADIEKYLAEALSSLSPFPSDEQIGQLGKSAESLFIYATTVARYILGIGPAGSTTRLDAMLAMAPQLANKGQSGRRYESLDQLYGTVLAAAFCNDQLEVKEVEFMKLVLRTVVCAKDSMTTVTLAALLGLTEEQVSSSLQPFQSVLHVSEASGLVSTFHVSFSDYMLDRARAGEFYCDQFQHSELLANRCFEVMKEQLRFNICNLESSFVYDQDVPDMEQRVKTCISPALHYACRHWGEHLQLSGASDVLHEKLVDFLTHRLLFWMEVLNLSLCVTRGAPVLIQARKWLLTAKCPTDTQKQVADARDFMTRFAASACIHSTPHIYVSALPFCTKSSSVYTHYWGRTQGLMNIRGTALSQRNKTAQAALVIDSEVLSVCFSPDGTRSVSGSADGTIRVWDVYTNNPFAGSFGGHTGSINSVGFSPDGTQIVSGSSDCTIRLWDAHTCDTVSEPFKGHAGSVCSVAFSPGSTCIVSGSNDRTILVWDAHTREAVAGPFKGHTGPVKSVAFSPDGTRIVSGSSDRTVRVWDSRTGDLFVGPLKEHMGPVKSVAFSPDGTRIVSGSDDCTIRVWDSRTGDNTIGPFTEHTGSVNSVAFSPDGARIVSGSSDRTVRVWDSRTSDTVAGPFREHTGSVNSVAFSPDGTLVFSGSSDFTIQVWDVLARSAIAGSLKGQIGWVNSVAFSPDGNRIVSGSSDQIRLWDAYTGDAIAGPFKGHTYSVNSVGFSPDGMHVVSGSSDRTIRVWSADNGNTVAGPFEGHTGWVNSVAFSPDGTRIVSGSSDQTIRVWDVQVGNILSKPFKGHTGWVNSVAFSPDGMRIASSSDDQTIRVWGAYTGDVVAGPFEGHIDSVKSVAFSPDGTRIVSGSSDRTIRLWDSHTGDLVAGPLEGHTVWVKSVAFSPDGTRVLSGSYDHTIRIWDARSGHPVADPFIGHSDSVNSAVFSPDGTRIVSGSDDGTIRVWCSCTSKVMAVPLEMHSHLVKSPRIPHNTDIITNADNLDYLLPGIPADPILNPTQRDPRPGTFIGNINFKLHKDGWVTADNVPLFWIPAEFRAHVPYSRNRLVIGSQGSVYISYQHLTLGESWQNCYIPQ